MKKRELLIDTNGKTEEFEVDEFGRRFYVFAVSYNLLGGRQTKKIGDAVSLEAAISLAKVYVGRPVLQVRVKEIF